MSAPISSETELNRLLAAAVVNQTFCNLLLTNPALALTQGYHNETFQLTPKEQATVLSIEGAPNLATFANRLMAALSSA